MRLLSKRIRIERNTALALYTGLAALVFHVLLLADPREPHWLGPETKDAICSLLFVMLASVASFGMVTRSRTRGAKAASIALPHLLLALVVGPLLIWAPCIIRPVWLTIIGMIGGLIAYFGEYDLIDRDLQRIRDRWQAEPSERHQALGIIAEECRLYFDKWVLLLLTVGTVLAACMTILWTGSEPAFSLTHDERARLAVAMSFAYIAICGEAVIWVLSPLVRKFRKISDLVV